MVLPAKLLHAINIRNITQTAAEIYITGEIIDDAYKGWNLKDGYVFPADVKEALDSLQDKDLTIHINSCGGDVMAGIAIANMVKRHKCNTTAVVDAYAASIATQIFFSAKTRQMPKNTYIVIHKPMSEVSGNANDMLAEVKILDTIQEGIETIYNDCAQKGVDSKTIHKMVNADNGRGTWLTGEQAAEYFKVDVLDAVNAVNAADQGFMNFQNAPKDIHYQQPGEPPAENKADVLAKRAKIATALALTEEVLKDE